MAVRLESGTGIDGSGNTIYTLTVLDAATGRVLRGGFHTFTTEAERDHFAKHAYY